MDDKLIGTLKTVVIAGAVVLALGTALLVWLIVQRGRTPKVAAAPPPAAASAGTLALPADARIGQALTAGNQLVLLGEAGQGEGTRRFLAVLDLATGQRRYLLWIEPERQGAPP